MYRREYLDVHPQDLTPKGSRIEKALAEYKNVANPPCFINGEVRECPTLKIVTESQLNGIVFQHPYINVEELYALAEQSQVGAVKKTLFRLDTQKSKEFSNIEVLKKSWKDKVTATCVCWLLVQKR